MITSAYKKRPTPDSSDLVKLFDKIIQWRSGKYIHEELLFSDGWAFSSRETGPAFVREETIDFHPDFWDFVRIDCSASQEALVRHQAQNIVDGGFTGVKPVYGWGKDLLGFAPVPIMAQLPHQYFCSESCCIAKQTLGFYLGYCIEGLSPWKSYQLTVNELPMWLKAQK
jgi:hypothetical protein